MINRLCGNREWKVLLPKGRGLSLLRNAPRELSPSCRAKEGAAVSGEALVPGEPLVCGLCHPQRYGVFKLLLPHVGKW